MEQSALLVEVTRGDHVESRHHGFAVVADPQGRIVQKWGAVDTLIYPRSSAKFMQFLPAVLSGAADKAGFSEQAFALACASHHGEDYHVTEVQAMLAGAGVTDNALACGEDWPFDGEVMKTYIAKQGQKSCLRHMCSGKHAAMLAEAKHQGVSIDGYTDPEHPVQQRILSIYEQLCEIDPKALPIGIDGCQVPTLAMPLVNLAMGFARLGAPDALPNKLFRANDAFKEAVLRIRKAIATYPNYTAGETGFTTKLMQIFGEDLYLKNGAEGVMVAILPKRQLGIAVKCEDGAERGAQQIMIGVLQEIGFFDGVSPTQKQAVDCLISPALINVSGYKIGEVRCAPALKA